MRRGSTNGRYMDCGIGESLTHFPQRRERSATIPALYRGLVPAVHDASTGHQAAAR